MSDTISIRDPRAELSVESAVIMPTLSGLSGKTLAILNNGWTSMDRIAARLAEGLKSRYGIGEVLTFAIPTSTPADPTIIEAVVQRADFAVVGLAN
jgi:hypothetical protein